MSVTFLEQSTRNLFPKLQCYHYATFFSFKNSNVDLFRAVYHKLPLLTTGMDLDPQQRQILYRDLFMHDVLMHLPLPIISTKQPEYCIRPSKPLFCTPEPEKLGNGLGTKSAVNNL
jgi:hypothetical protein